MVWAGFSFDGRTRLVFLDGVVAGRRRRVNAQRYVDDVLRPVVIPYLNARPGTSLQQDNARPHSARLTQAVLEQNNVDVLPWPSLSPDINPIEHVWDYLKKKLHDNDMPRQETQAWSCHRS